MRKTKFLLIKMKLIKIRSHKISISGMLCCIYGLKLSVEALLLSILGLWLDQ